MALNDSEDENRPQQAGDQRSPDPNTTIHHDGHEFRFSERSNGCYIESDEHGQFLLKPKPTFRNLQFLPISDETKLQMAQLLDDAIEWLDEGDGADRNWFDDMSRVDKLLKYVDQHWSNTDEGLILRVAVELANEGLMLCNRTGDLFELGNWTAPTGSYVCTIKADEGNRCPNCGAPKDEFWECIRSSNRTRVPSVYKCQNCDHKTRGITTG